MTEERLWLAVVAVGLLLIGLAFFPPFHLTREDDDDE